MTTHNTPKRCRQNIEHIAREKGTHEKGKN